MTADELMDIITDCVEDLELYESALHNPLDDTHRTEILSNMIDTARKLSVHCQVLKSKL